MSVSDAQFEQYQRNGYVVVKDCLDGATVEAVTDRIESYVRNERKETQFERMLEPDAAEDALDDAEPVRKFEGLGMVEEDEMFEDLVSTIHERDFLQRTFGRYMSQQVLEEILDGKVELGGERRQATVLFADIRDFTRLTERMEPEDIVRLLNDYFEHMVQGITENNGIPDKFLGDGLLAVWGVPFSDDNHEQQAVQGALAMLEYLRSFNEKRRQMDRPTIEIGTSVHSGELIAGNIGSQEKMEYTVIGDTVNTCNRLEAYNKEFGSVLIISEVVHDSLDPELQDRFKERSTVTPEGKQESITVFYLTKEGLIEPNDDR